jgi:ABC-2 type transport system permease protein
VTGLLSYEWRRLRSLRANRALFAGVVAFALLADLAAAGRPLDAEGVVFHVVQRDLAVRWLVAAAIGAQAFGHEFRYGTIRPTLVAFPRRGRLLAGKTAAAALAGTAGALLASAASLGLLAVVARWDGGLLADPRLWRSLAYGAVTVGLVAALAAGLGALTRGTGLPVVLLALWAGIVEPLVAAAMGGGAGLLPFLSMLQLAAYTGQSLDLGGPAAGPLSLVVFPLFLAAVLAAAAVVFAGRDATGS